MQEQAEDAQVHVLEAPGLRAKPDPDRVVKSGVFQRRGSTLAAARTERTGAQTSSPAGKAAESC